MKKSKIVLCTAKYSDNLGDGIISDCSKKLLLQSEPDATVVELDISGRTEFSVQSEFDENWRSALKNKILSAPNFIKYSIVVILWLLFTRSKLLKQTKLSLNKANLLVFGGGQLILDNFLSFPLKFYLISKTAHMMDIPIVVLGCGVGSKKSYLAEYLYKKSFSLKSFRAVYLRDINSKNSFIERFGDSFSGVVGLTSDSALYSSETYNKIKADKAKSFEELLVGVGISHPSELKAASSEEEGFSDKKIEKLWINTLNELNRSNYNLMLYTNGSAEDELFLSNISKKLNFIPQVAVRPISPLELVENISKFDVTLSHRLHSSIISSSLNIPSIGLSWDRKVMSFYEATNRSKFCLKGDDFYFNEIDLLIKELTFGDCFFDINNLKELMLSSTRNAIKDMK